MARRLLYVDASAGASGDMILGALVDLGVPLARIRAAVRSLPIDGWTLRARRVTRGSLAGRKVDVGVRGKQPQRGWRVLRRILAGGALATPVRDRALEIFRRLIEAEAEVHGSAPERIHLHEAGGVDAIVDVVGACVGLAYLEVEAIVVSPMTTGFGSVRCEHGVLPVPAPATLQLVRGCPVQAGTIEAERLTPTGAAVLTTVADAWGPLPPMRPLRVGSGFGERDLGETPNLLRMILGESDFAGAGAGAGAATEVAVIGCTLDDATPQLLAHAMERLRETGALEVFATPVTMKKGRPGHDLTVLCRPDALARLAELLLAETPSLGLRYRFEDRIELERESRTVNTAFGRLPIKLGLRDGRVVQAWPEYEPCARAAREHEAPLREVQRAVLRAWEAAAPRRRRRR